MYTVYPSHRHILYIMSPCHCHYIIYDNTNLQTLLSYPVFSDCHVVCYFLDTIDPDLPFI